MSEKFGFIYLWYDKKHKRFYLGSHWGTETDGYVCSSRWMRKAYRRRPEDFKRRIITRIYDRKNLLIEEARLLATIKPEEQRVRYYNLNYGGIGHWTATEDKKTISTKISISTKAAMQRPEVRAKYEAGLKERKQPHDDPDYRERIRQTNLSKSLNKGMLTVRYPNEDKHFHVATDDPRWLNGELISSTGHKSNPRKRPGLATGERHHMFSGYYHTPWGKFNSAGEAAAACPLGPIHEDVIWQWCKDKCDQVFHTKGRPPKIMNSKWWNKTRREVGFHFEEIA